MCRKLKIEKYAWKIIAITTIAILVSTITLEGMLNLVETM